MSKRFTIIFTAILIIIVAFLIQNNLKEKKDLINNNVEIATSTEESVISTEKTDTATTLSTKDHAWALFQKYLDYNKKLNLAGVKSVVYKVASVCEDEKTKSDCDLRMSSAYEFGSTLKKEDFVNTWGDEKQLILSTKYEENEDDQSIVWNCSVIYFIKGSDGNWKLLSFTPIKSIIVAKSSASRSELEDRLKIYSEDSDQDGLTNYTEECLDSRAEATCIKTDPKSRDTDKDGWWDSIEPLLK